MLEKKPFLAHILTLDQLARQLEMPPRALSNTINRHFKQNFFEFVNHYRVEEAKTLLADPEQKTKTMIEVMADSGFNSKATFNTFFKKLVGATPSQYRADQYKGQ
jgi:AraC-like DNA-binding protein